MFHMLPPRPDTYPPLEMVIDRLRDIQLEFKEWQHVDLEGRYYLINKAMIANLDALQTISAALGALITDRSDDI